MVVLSYGYKQPVNGDRGSVWFPALNDNIQRLNDHSHNGVNSALLPASSIQLASVVALAASWSADGVGRYKQTLTTPAGINVNDYCMITRITNGDVINPTIVKLTDFTFEIYSLDSSLEYTVIFR